MKTTHTFLLLTAFLLGTLTTATFSGCGGEGKDKDKKASSSKKDDKKSKAKKEEPKKEEPKKEEPKKEAPKKEEVKKEAPKKEAPKKEAPKKEAPKKEAPKKEAPKKEAPKKEAPKKEAPKKEAPKKEAKKEAPKAEAKKEAPKKEAPVSGKATTTAKVAAKNDPRNPIIKAGDWAQWGGNSLRNNTPIGKNIPIEWEVGDFDREGKWISDDAINIKWVSRVGSQTYGNVVVAGGRAYIGTNNGAGYLKRYSSRVDLGCLICFDEKTGKFLWQHSSEKLPTGRVHDWPLQGVCCAPLVEGDRVWFVSSRGHVVCCDAQGYYDGEDDGPIKAEQARLFNIRKNDDASKDKVTPAAKELDGGKVNDALRASFKSSGFELPAEVKVATKAAGKSWTLTAKVGKADRTINVKIIGPNLSAFKVVTIDDKEEADVIWSYDMMAELKVSQHNMCSCSVTALGDILFVNTSNGVDESHINIPSPDAPSFMAMDKNTGKVYWTDKSPGVNILHGQWSSPTVAYLAGEPQVIFGGGDGWVYSFRADKGKDGKPTLLWKFDANPKTSKWILGGRGTRNNIIATPVVYDGRVYVAVGQDPEHGEGVGHLWCIDPSKRGDVSPELAVSKADSKPIAHQRLQAVIEEQGQAVVANKNSAVIWHYSQFDQNGDGTIDFEEEMHRSCGTVAIKNDILYIADFSGLFHCLDAKTGKVHWTYDMLAAAWGSPLIVNGHVYIGDEDGDVCIFKLTKEKHEPISEITMGNSVYSTPVVANDVLFISNKDHLFAIEAKDAK